MSNGTRLRILGVYAHPDDETFCSGGTFASYAAAGGEVMVVSATRGQAGQIRSPQVTTRSRLAEIRETELRNACRALGVRHVDCWEYGDGQLRDVPGTELEQRLESVIDSFCPDLVVTFGEDGAYGHPDHIAISRATTNACARLWDPANPARRLYHAVFPARRLLLMDKLVKWLIDEGPDFRGDPQFVYALLLLAEEASTLHAVADHYEIKWFPPGISIIEQGEPAASLFLLLSGRADVIREDATGQRRFVAGLMPGQFFGEQGIASGKPRNAHVIAAEPVTCLVLSPREPSLFEGRGTDARLVIAGPAAMPDEDVAGATTRVDCGEFLSRKLNALAAYRSQFPMRPDMLPESIFREVLGAEYFRRILPGRELERDLGFTPQFALTVRGGST